MTGFGPVLRKLYLRIWLAVVGAVLLLSLLIGAAWRWSEHDRERPPLPPREVLVQDAGGRVVGSAQAEPRRGPGQPLEFHVTLDDGRQLQLVLPPRGPRGGPDGAPRWRPEGGPSGRLRAPDPWWGWMRPPYGFLWLLALVGLAVSIGVLPVARRLTQRLETLQRGVQRWGEGDLAVRVPEGGADEVADVSRRFNAAATRIQGLMDAQAALLQSQKSLLANASHELRSPLARIRMALELSGEAPSPSARAEIARNIAELDQLVDEILLASRLDAPGADLGRVEPIDLIGLLAEECARVDADLDLQDGLTELSVPGVPKLVRRAVRNLLENAARYGRRAGASGTVLVELAQQPGQAVLHVNDHGPGVPADQRECIFEPFYRLPGASERDGGVGLGLALVRSIAERHGGTVACAERPGGGARFTLRLPLA